MTNSPQIAPIDRALRRHARPWPLARTIRKQVVELRVAGNPAVLQHFSGNACRTGWFELHYDI